MPKKRANGEGNIRKRKDGRWEGRYTAGRNENGKPIYRNVLGRTQAEVKEKLAKAIEPAVWRGVGIQRGQAITSYQSISQALAMTVDEVRTAIKHLKSTGEITYTTTSKFGLVTVNNYCEYQGNPTQLPTKIPANFQLTSHSQKEETPT